LPARWGRIDEVLTQRRTIRLCLCEGDAAASGLPAGFPAPTSLLVVPISSQNHVYGWLCLIGKTEPGGFTLDDESVAGTLAAQAGRAYESAALYREALERIVTLETRLRQREALAGPA
jgi:GAF domain-containing protein